MSTEKRVKGDEGGGRQDNGWVRKTAIMCFLFRQNLTTHPHIKAEGHYLLEKEIREVRGKGQA